MLNRASGAVLISAGFLFSLLVVILAPMFFLLSDDRTRANERHALEAEAADSWTSVGTNSLIDAISAARAQSGFAVASMTSLPPINGTIEERTEGQTFSNYELFANNLNTTSDGLVLLALAPGGVFNQVFPADMDIVGTDTLDPSYTFVFAPVPIQTVKEGQTAIIGPVQHAIFHFDTWVIVVRQPVYNSSTSLQQGETNFWGFTYACIGVQKLLSNHQSKEHLAQLNMDFITYTYTTGLTEELAFIDTSLPVNKTQDLQKVLDEFLVDATVRNVLGGRVRWFVAVRSKFKPQRLTANTAVIIVVSGLFSMMLFYAITLVVYLYATRSYDGMRHAPKKTPFAMSLVGLYRGEDLLELAPEQIVNVAEDIQQLIRKLVAKHHAYEGQQLRPYTFTIIFRTVHDAVRFGYDVIEEIFAREVDGTLRTLLGELGRPCASSVIHWCSDASVTLDPTSNSLRYIGPDVLHGSLMWMYADPNSVTLTEAAHAEVQCMSGAQSTLVGTISVRGSPEKENIFHITDPSRKKLHEASTVASAVLAAERERAKDFLAGLNDLDPYTNGLNYAEDELDFIDDDDEVYDGQPIEHSSGANLCSLDDMESGPGNVIAKRLRRKNVGARSHVVEAKAVSISNTSFSSHNPSSESDRAAVGRTAKWDEEGQHHGLLQDTQKKRPSLHDLADASLLCSDASGGSKGRDTVVPNGAAPAYVAGSVLRAFSDGHASSKSRGMQRCDTASPIPTTSDNPLSGFCGSAAVTAASSTAVGPKSSNCSANAAAISPKVVRDWFSLSSVVDVGVSQPEPNSRGTSPVKAHEVFRVPPLAAVHLMGRNSMQSSSQLELCGEAKGPLKDAAETEDARRAARGCGEQEPASLRLQSPLSPTILHTTIRHATPLHVVPTSGNVRPPHAKNHPPEQQEAKRNAHTPASQRASYAAKHQRLHQIMEDGGTRLPPHIRALLTPHIPVWIDAALRTAFEQQAASYGMSYEAARVVVYHFFYAYRNMLKPFASPERLNIYKRLVMAFGIPQQNIVEHLAVRCAVQYLYRQDDQRNLMLTRRIVPKRGEPSSVAVSIAARGSDCFSSSNEHSSSTSGLEARWRRKTSEGPSREASVKARKAMTAKGVLPPLSIVPQAHETPGNRAKTKHASCHADRHQSLLPVETTAKKMRWLGASFSNHESLASRSLSASSLSSSSWLSSPQHPAVSSEVAPLGPLGGGGTPSQ